MYYSVTECRLVTKFVLSNFYFEQVNVHAYKHKARDERGKTETLFCFVLSTVLV